MTRTETNLLLYLETRAVDYDGVVDTDRMNAEDRIIAKRWNEAGFIRYGRISSVLRGPATHRVELSDEAWSAAHAARKERGTRDVELQKKQAG